MKIKVKLQKGIFLCLATVLAAVIFSQAFESPVSSAVLRFTLYFIAADILIWLLSAPFASVNPVSSSQTVRKGASRDVAFVLRNPTLFPLVTAEVTAKITVGGETAGKTECFTVLPFGRKFIVLPMDFRCRGVYTSKVSKLAVFDPLRLISLEKYPDDPVEITVLPDLIPADLLPELSHGAEEGERAVKNFTGDGEYADLRGFREGDRLRDVHWKLSARLEDELYVRETESSGSARYDVICDLRDAGKDADSLLADDIVAECAYSYAVSLLGKGQNGEFISHNVRCPFGDSLAYTAARAASGTEVLRSQNRAVFVTPYLPDVSPAVVGEALSRGSADIVLCDVSSALKTDVSEYKASLESFSKAFSCSVWEVKK